MPKPQASCTLTVAEGMVVNTQATSAGRRQGPAGTDGVPADQPPARLPGLRQGRRVPAAEPGDEQRPRRDPVHRAASGCYPKPINISAQVLLDRERCVLCARCTRFSEQIAGDPFIALIERGALQQVGIYEKEPFESYFSGNTIQICPVGALTSSAYRFRSRPFDLVSTPSIAEIDACGSAIRVDHRRGKVMRRLSGDDPEVNEEWITDKDRFAPPLRRASTDRLTYPMVRDERPRAGRAAPGELARGVRGGRPRPGRCARGRRRRRAHRWSADRRGLLRLLEVRPGRARHQRHRLPRPRALRRGGRVPGRARGARPARPAARSRTPTSRPPGPSCSSGFEPEDEAGTVFLRLRKAARGRLLPIYSIAPFTSRGPAQDVRHADPDPAGRRARRDRGASAHDGEPSPSTAAALILVGERMAAVPGALAAVSKLADDHRRPRRVDPAPRR